MDRKRRYIKFNEAFIKNYDENSDKANKRIYLGQAILDNRHLCMNFGMITLSLSMVIKHDYVTRIQIALSSMLKQMVFTKILVMTLIIGLIHLI